MDLKTFLGFFFNVLQHLWFSFVEWSLRMACVPMRLRNNVLLWTISVDILYHTISTSVSISVKNWRDYLLKFDTLFSKSCLVCAILSFLSFYEICICFPVSFKHTVHLPIVEANTKIAASRHRPNSSVISIKRLHIDCLKIYKYWIVSNAYWFTIT